MTVGKYLTACFIEAGSSVALASLKLTMSLRWLPPTSCGSNVFPTTLGLTHFKDLVFHICKMRLAVVVAGIDKIIM